ncbi:hypothetical protein MJO28_000823 [Puccinia striiformis f. sp. tritici]|uniref:Uncharacterized protein n=4 Tax=Puccinia striiformis TaxID=27350 RepID=A0A2S4VIM1_9BASI|nr:hypothetical protein MJO28_000823 [Puccinia striiformis f. sp. tritici]POW09329.1 hypothetical protein PSTT_06898 [Puccinia striiformis]POW17777.1 hypothetical protein PSHT_06293 [Puccinia striiformis]
MKRVSLLPAASSRASIFSFQRIQRFRKVIDNLKTQLTAKAADNHNDSFKKVKMALEANDYWTAGSEISRFQKMHGRVNSREMQWFVDYQQHILKSIKNHVRATVVISIEQASSDCCDWLHLGIPVEVVAAVSAKTYQ